MEYGTIEREIHVDASPEVVFEVISSPEHLQEWWPDEAVLDGPPAPGAVGELAWGAGETPRVHVESFTVVDALPPRLFSFRWVYEAPDVPGPGNSLLVTFELEPSGEGTRVRMTESGFRERGWEVAVLEAAYREHVEGWDHFIPRLGAYVARLVSS
jgi:uncharacterized protein YndB with AHSA1/START domain